MNMANLTHVKRAILACVLLLGTTAALAAPRSIDETRSVSPDGELEIELIAGEITISGWGGDEVQITGRYDDDFESVEIDADGGDISIELEPIKDEWDNYDSIVELDIRLPAGMEISIEVISGEITIENVDGSVSIESVSGEIEVAPGPREVEIEVISGHVLVESRGDLRNCELSSVSGDIELRGDIDPRGSYSLESLNGTVTLRLPSNTSADFEIETFSGDIKNDFGPQAKRDSEYVPSKSLTFTLGDGAADISASSFSGTVKVIED